MKLAIHGAAGRMGQALVRLAQEADDIALVGAVGSAASPLLGRDVGEIAGCGNIGVALGPDVGAALLGADVVIDFSTADAFDGVVRAATRAGVALLSGTTRLSEASQRRLQQASTQIPTLWAANMSLGVHVLGELVQHAIRSLGPDYDIEIVETHHKRKTDAPSGTAMYLLDQARAARRAPTDVDAHGSSPAVHGREGQVGARTANEIGMHALRGGGVIGDHSVHLISEHDRIAISHRAIHRDLFAAGALRAARFLSAQPAGHYSMTNVLEAR